MEENNGEFSDKLKNSFSNVKKDILELREEINSIKDSLNLEKKDFLDLKNKIDEFSAILKEKKDKIEDLENVPQEIEGFINNDQQSSTIINDKQQSSTMSNNQQSTSNPKHSVVPRNMLEELENDFSQLFRNLTDREFSIFTAIYEHERKNGETDYTEIANYLNLTETTVRGVVNRLIAKNLPVVKERAFNGKTSLFLKKDFYELNLMNKLIRLRQGSHDQTTLFSSYDPSASD